MMQSLLRIYYIKRVDLLRHIFFENGHSTFEFLQGPELQVVCSKLDRGK